MVDVGGLKIYQSILTPQWHPVQTQFITDKTQMEFYFVFPGTNHQYDRIKDLNILLDVNPNFNPYYTSVQNFTNKIIQVLTDFSNANGGVGTTQNIPVVIVAHSLGAHIASRVRYNLIKHGIGLEYGLVYEAFCPFVWKDAAYDQELTSATARQVEINVAGSGINQYTANYNLYCVVGDVVSLHAKTIGYGHAFYRPAKDTAGFMGSLAHFTGVAEANTPENHKIDNWVDILQGAIRPTALLDTPLTIRDVHLNVVNQIDTGNWVLSSRRSVLDNGHYVYLNLESNTSGLSGNIHKGNTEQDADHPTYRWTVTKQDHIIGYSSSTNEDEHRYITELWKLHNVNNNAEIFVYLKKDHATTYPNQGVNANRLFWLLQDAITGNLYQISDDANLTGATLGLNGQPVINANSITSYRYAKSISDATLYKTYEWSLEAEASVHRVNDWNDVAQMAPGDLRRVLVNDSGTAYVPINYAILPTDADATYSSLLRGSPPSELFAIESVQYPGFFLKASTLGGWSADSATGSTIYTIPGYTFEQPLDVSNLSTDFRFFRSGGNADYIASLLTSSKISAAVMGSNQHAIMAANGSSDIFAIDCEFSLNYQTDSYSCMTVSTISGTHYFGLLSGSGNIEYGNINTTDYSISNVPIGSQFKIIWL